MYLYIHIFFFHGISIQLVRSLFVFKLNRCRLVRIDSLNWIQSHIAWKTGKWLLWLEYYKLHRIVVNLVTTNFLFVHRMVYSLTQFYLLCKKRSYVNRVRNNFIFVFGTNRWLIIIRYQMNVHRIVVRIKKNVSYLLSFKTLFFIDSRVLL